MAKRNLTVELDDEVIRKAKIVAAKRGTSVSRLVAMELEDLSRAMFVTRKLGSAR